MDEKVEAQKPAESAAAPSPPATPPPTDPPPIAQGAAPEGDQGREKMSTSDLIMSIATGVIALGTLVSAAAIVMQWREMVNGGADTTAIKLAAQKQADAAQKFADTAVLINSGVGDAVKKLDAQAQATQESANAAKSAANTASDALVSVQRAFVLADAAFIPIYKTPTSTQAVSLIVQPNWNNSGVTPTKNFTMHASQLYLPGALPVGFDFPDLWDAGAPHVATPAVIGPRGSVGAPNVTIPLATEELIADGKTHLYLWGWARYSDAFPRTPPHISEYCWEVKVYRVAGTPDIEETFIDKVSNCQTHNCYDEECH